MRRWALGAALLAAAGVLAADVAMDAAVGSPTPAEPNYYDAPTELKWDSGVASYSHCWYTGAGSWVGVDFSIATLTDYRLITQMRLYCRYGWPNSAWEGGRMGVYAYGTVPGSMLWGPTWFKPTLTSSGFQDFGIGWVLPAGSTSFIIAWEQYYGYPNADSYTVDNSTVTTGHSWDYYGGSWSRLSNTTGYNNLMLRAVVDDVNNVGIAPTSLGRVKAVYY